MTTSITPDGSARALTAAGTLTHQALAEAFSAQVPRKRLPVVYVVGLLAVAVIMLILPLLYFALIGAVGYGVYYHAVHNLDILTAADGGAGGSRGRLFLYAIPLFVGAVLILFMTKPLFAPRARRGKPVSISPHEDPVLFEYISRLCDAVGAPMPSRIDVDCSVNASAGLRRGLLSMFGSDLVLTIGLPLAAGMTLPQFTGVLAHEFGHFTQGAGMRLYYLINRINMWFGRVAYERDTWDLRLAQMCASGEIMLIVPGYIARACVGATRLVLKGFVLFAHAASCFMSRQMEYDADSYEAAVSGSAEFAPTSDQIIALSVAADRTFAEMGDRWTERRLPDDLPSLIAGTRRSMPRDILEKALKQLHERKTGLFDTHPSQAARTRHAEALAMPGVLTLDAPAHVVFSDFEALCKRASRDHYEMVLGGEIATATLVPTRRVLMQQDATDSAVRGLEELFDREVLDARPIYLDISWIEPPKDVRATAKRMLAAAGRLTEARGALKESATSYAEIKERFVLAAQAHECSMANIKFRPDTYKVSTKKRAELKDHLEQLRGRMDFAGQTFSHYESAANEYITAALQLTHVEKITARLKNGAKYSEWAQQQLQLIAAARDCRTAVKELTENVNRMAALLHVFRAYAGDDVYINRIRRVEEDMRRNLNSIRTTFAVVTYPFEHGRGQLTVAQYLLECMPPEGDIGNLMDATLQTLDRFWTMYHRSLGLLVHIARQVEGAVRAMAQKQVAPRPASTPGASVPARASRGTP